ncbi:hypothetical protein TraAM80_10041 [Trypanosoma rangeli]|uniref:Uncharacterized protein n=1 Tax=Trypanosoma rangeli TaxID=5698 RepID=A0A3R7N3R8_TRYRA|nr:uncharacterized protein TraAM80_10041 [Trypanosoma rangeli]RNE95956.1 hypothetical protein TraAM80_10041 [Trypanosoma rangeli]|eukprot:RNE95956.1 hypothetical protein TraAM80_10041 [Trypanosoma rangeli]
MGRKTKGGDGTPRAASNGLLEEGFQWLLPPLLLLCVGVSGFFWLEVQLSSLLAPPCEWGSVCSALGRASFVEACPSASPPATPPSCSTAPLNSPLRGWGRSAHGPRP